MSKKEIIFILNKLVEDLELIENNPGSNIVVEKYELDSLSFLNFITAIESKYEIEFEDNVTYDELNNYENLINLISIKCNCR